MPPARPVWLPPIRLRYVLGFTLLAWFTSWVVPRARAAWETHELGSAYGNYAACMAGPRGAQLLRDDLAGFRQLVRRRVVSASAKEVPFARCLLGAERLIGSERALRAHRQPAGRFAEHGSELSARTSIDQLELGTEPLKRAVRAAWPFVRGSYASLIKPSLAAREAMHPVPPPEPGVGRGLPASTGMVKASWRVRDAHHVVFGLGETRALFHSADGGRSFRAVVDSAAHEPAARRCAGRVTSRGFELSTIADGSLFVTSVTPESEPHTTLGVRGEHRLLAATCDDHAFVLAAQREGAERAEVVLCRHERRCEPLRLPSVAPFEPLAVQSFDLVRSSGATIVAVASGGVVRVISSRDDGKSWTPPTVAFDAGEAPAEARARELPFRLAPFGPRVLLHGASRAGEGYTLLASDDQGASFHALSEPAAPPARERVASSGRSR